MMADWFSHDWMKGFMAAWNADPDLSNWLSGIGFNSVIGYGFPEDEEPVGVIVVENGRVVHAGAYAGQALDWDLRATGEDWRKWAAKGIGMMGLGLAYTSGRLRFKAGDYKAMIRDPRLSGAFIRSVTVMGQVDT
jgi:hypothetical protein